jgi:hypothetical protein
LEQSAGGLRCLRFGSRPNTDALQWLKRQGITQARSRVAELVSSEADRRVQIWMRVALRGEGMSDLAREFD